MVTADGRILESYSLQVNESSLDRASPPMWRSGKDRWRWRGTAGMEAHRIMVYLRQPGDRGTRGVVLVTGHRHADRDRQDRRR